MLLYSTEPVYLHSYMQYSTMSRYIIPFHRGRKPSNFGGLIKRLPSEPCHLVCGFGSQFAIASQCLLVLSYFRGLKEYSSRRNWFSTLGWSVLYSTFWGMLLVASPKHSYCVVFVSTCAWRCDKSHLAVISACLGHPFEVSEGLSSRASNFGGELKPS